MHIVPLVWNIIVEPTYTMYVKSLLISEGNLNYLSCISYMCMILIECQIYIAGTGVTVD